MNISITGNLGAGKSSVCKILKERGYEIISAGTIFRQLAAERGLSVEELNAVVNRQIAEGGSSEIDTQIDERTTLISRTRDMVVFDARLGWHFAENTFKVFVYVDVDEAARRIYQDASRADSEQYASLEDCRRAIIHRQQLEAERFRDLYQLDFYNLCNYDVVLDSTFATPEQVTEQLLKSLEAYEAGKTVGVQIMLSPRGLYPARPIAIYSDEEAKSADDAASAAGIRAGVCGNTWLVTDGVENWLAAAKAEEVFVRVKYDDPVRPDPLTAEEYAAAETAGGFRYKKYPDKEALCDSGIIHYNKLS